MQMGIVNSDSDGGDVLDRAFCDGPFCATTLISGLIFVDEVFDRVEVLQLQRFPKVV